MYYHPECAESGTKEAKRARAALRIIVPSHPVNIRLSKGFMGYGDAAAYAAFRSIRLSLPPPPV